jgi:hypothetical protein
MPLYEFSVYYRLSVTLPEIVDEFTFVAKYRAEAVNDNEAHDFVYQFMRAFKTPVCGYFECEPDTPNAKRSVRCGPPDHLIVFENI